MVESLRAVDKRTVPSLLDSEKAINLFIHEGQSSVVRAVGLPN